MAEGGLAVLEGYTHTTNQAPNPHWVPVGPNMELATAHTGITLGPFPNNPMEAVMQYNSCQEWANYSAWGPSIVPLDAGTNALICGVQQMSELALPAQPECTEERNFVLGGQIRSKNKDVMRGPEKKKTRKSFAASRGKAKVIPTGHKTPPKAIWVKRSGASVANEQKGSKKPRVNSQGEGIKIMEANQEMGEPAQETNTLTITEIDDKEEAANKENAESGDNQLRQEK